MGGSATSSTNAAAPGSTSPAATPVAPATGRAAATSALRRAAASRSGLACASRAADPGHDRRGGARAGHGAESPGAVVDPPGLRRGETDTRCAQLGLGTVGKGQPFGRERCRRRDARVLVERCGTHVQLDGPPGGKVVAHLERDGGREAEHGHLERLGDPERAGGERPVDEHGLGARGGELLHRLGRRRARRQQHRGAGDPAEAVRVEQPLEAGLATDHRNPACRERDDGCGGRAACDDGAAQRLLTGQQHAQPGAEEDVHGRAATTRVGGRDGDGGTAGRRRADASVARTGRAVVSCRARRRRCRAPGLPQRLGPAVRPRTTRTAPPARRARCAPRRAHLRRGSDRRRPRARRASGRCGSRSTHPLCASGCQPATRIGRRNAFGATPCSPAGPSEPTTSPASSVP